MTERERECCLQVTIKLAQFEEWDEAVSQFVFHNDTNFEPIRFLVRDGDGSKSTLLIAQVEAGKGIVLYDQHGQEIFTASLPSHSAKALGEIKTANGFTAYVIERLCHGNLSVQKTVGTEDEKPIQVKRIKNRYAPFNTPPFPLTSFSLSFNVCVGGSSASKPVQILRFF